MNENESANPQIYGPYPPMTNQEVDQFRKQAAGESPADFNDFELMVLQGTHQYSNRVEQLESAGLDDEAHDLKRYVDSRFLGLAEILMERSARSSQN